MEKLQYKLVEIHVLMYEMVLTINLGLLYLTNKHNILKKKTNNRQNALT